MKKKILVTTGTRAEYGILRPVLQAIQKSKKLELYLVVTGTHLSKKYGLTINEIKRDRLKIAATVKMMPENDTLYLMSKKLGEGIIAFSKIIHKFKPHVNLVLGDRDEMLASTIAAYHMNVPNVHIHGGDKSRGIDEYNRHAITKMSNIHFVATKKSKERVIRMGEDPKCVFLTGSPSIDEIVSSKISNKKELERKYGIKFTGKEILLIQHPVTTQPQFSEKQIRQTLYAIVKIGNTTVAIAPNSDAGNKAIFKYLKLFSSKYHFIKMYASLPRRDYLGMIKNCGVLVGNSSSGMIEASYFQTPVVNIGIRQEGRERGKNVFDVKEDSKSIYCAISKALKMRKYIKNSGNYLYGHGGTSKKIVRYLEKINFNKDLIQKQIVY